MHRLLRHAVAALVAASSAGMATPRDVSAQVVPLSCDMSGYIRRADTTARVSGDVLAVECG